MKGFNELRRSTVNKLNIGSVEFIPVLNEQINLVEVTVSFLEFIIISPGNVEVLLARLHFQSFLNPVDNKRNFFIGVIVAECRVWLERLVSTPGVIVLEPILVSCRACISAIKNRCQYLFAGPKSFRKRSPQKLHLDIFLHLHFLFFVHSSDKHGIEAKVCEKCRVACAVPK